MIYKRIYYIVFDNVKDSRWWKFDKKINHCYLITGITDNSSIIINHTETGTTIQGYKVPALDLVDNILKKAKTVVRHEVNDNHFKTSVSLLKSRSCVEICKDLLGISKFWLFTPRQLYKYLVGK